MAEIVKSEMSKVIKLQSNSTSLSSATNETAPEEATPAPTPAPPPPPPPLPPAPSKVQVRLYMESECPACKMLVTQVVSTVLNAPGMTSIMDFKLVPWGNAQVTRGGKAYNQTSVLSQMLTGGDDELSTVSFSCQHGSSECEGNAWESCIQHLHPDTSFPVIDCIERHSCAEGESPPKCKGPPGQVAPECLRLGGMDLDEVNGCVNGAMASKLLIKNAMETDSLSPAKQWVPWVTLDGKHLGQSNPSRVFLRASLLPLPTSPFLSLFLPTGCELGRPGKLPGAIFSPLSDFREWEDC